MSYITGTANSLADLMTAVQNACTDAGWTLGSGILNKGNCHTQLAVVGDDLNVLGGLDSALGTPGAVLGSIGKTNAPASIALTFPAVFNIHVLTNPDEVYLFVNYSVSLWQWLAFGCSPAPGIPGTGAWYSASNPRNGFDARPVIYINGDTAGAYGSSRMIFGQSWQTQGNSYIHHGLDSVGWSQMGTNSGAGTAGLSTDAWGQANPILDRQPNQWNGETSLVPVNIFATRPSGKYSLVGSLEHCRYVRNDNYSDGEIITIGSDQWKTYPGHRKDATARTGTSGGNHTGTFAHAIRYEV